MKFQDKLIKQLAKKYNRDPRVIKEIVESPLKFTSRVVQSPSDNRPVRIKYFGSFVQKGYFNKTTRMEKKVNELLENIDEVALLMAGVLEFITIRSAEDAKKYIEIARDNIDIDKIDFIYEAWKKI